MSDIRCSCAQCGQHIACTSNHAGQQVSCPNCGGPVTVPLPVVTTLPQTEIISQAAATLSPTLKLMLIGGGIAALAVGLVVVAGLPSRLRSSNPINRFIADSVSLNQVVIQGGNLAEFEAKLHSVISDYETLETQWKPAAATDKSKEKALTAFRLAKTSWECGGAFWRLKLGKNIPISNDQLVNISHSIDPNSYSEIILLRGRKTFCDNMRVMAFVYAPQYLTAGLRALGMETQQQPEALPFDIDGSLTLLKHAHFNNSDASVQGKQKVTVSNAKASVSATFFLQDKGITRAIVDCYVPFPLRSQADYESEAKDVSEAILATIGVFTTGNEFADMAKWIYEPLNTQPLDRDNPIRRTRKYSFFTIESKWSVEQRQGREVIHEEIQFLPNLMQ